MPAIDTDLLRAVLYSQLELLAPEAREAATKAAIDKLNYMLDKANIPKLPDLPPQENSRMTQHLQEIQNEGITLLGPLLNTTQVNDIHSYLQQKKTYNGHVWSFSDRNRYTIEEVKKKHRQASYFLEDVVNAPHLLETMTSPFILKLVEQYLGCTPTLFQSNLLWSFQDDPTMPAVAQDYHRDWDNFRFCVLFVYMTDVDEQTGPHEYVRKSHRVQGVRDALTRYQSQGGEPALNVDAFFRGSGRIDAADAVRDVFKSDVIQIEKPAGHAFLSDAFGLHRGIPLVKGQRLLFWARYGLYDNGFSVDTTPGPLPIKAFTHRIQNDKTHRYINRAILKSEYSQSPVITIQPVPQNFNVKRDALLHRMRAPSWIARTVKDLQQYVEIKSPSLVKKIKNKIR